MLPRNQRLHTAQFGEVMNKGNVVHTSLFTLRYIKNAPDTRISATISPKIARKAVIRNKTRRAMYAALMPLMSTISKNTWSAVLAKEPVLKLSQNEIEAGLRELFVKPGLLR